VSILVDGACVEAHICEEEWFSVEFPELMMF
jgi:hypothetical protein